MRIRQFDVLRAIAILLVLGDHVTWNPLWSRFGWTGVDLFFCLSGFLVSGLLFRDYKTSGKIRWKRFLIRRGFKIYPAYIAFLLLGTIVFGRVFGFPISWSNIWPDVFFLQDYFVGTWGHLWSLGIEEQFYLALPAVLWMVARYSRRDNPFRVLPWLCGLVAIGCIAMRAARVHELPAFNHYSHMRPFHLRCDSLLFGVLLSWLHEFHRKVILPRILYANGHLLLAISLLCLLPAVLVTMETPFLYVFGLTLIYLGYGGILLHSLYCCSGRSWLARLLAWIGQASYSIYLWHLPVATLSVSILQNQWHWGRNAVFGTYMFASVATGVVMARLIEKPMLRARERFCPEKATGSEKASLEGLAPQWATAV